jgi:hypothetical protein
MLLLVLWVTQGAALGRRPAMLLLLPRRRRVTLLLLPRMQ